MSGPSVSYAARTTVPADRTRAEIEKLLDRYGATEFAYGRGSAGAVIGFAMGGRYIRYSLPVPDPGAAEFTKTQTGRRRSGGEAQAAHEQAVRQRWRALLLIIRAKLEAVAAGVSTMESEFLAWTLVPDGRTVGDWLAPHLARVYAGGELPALLPGPSRD